MVNYWTLYKKDRANANPMLGSLSMLIEDPLERKQWLKKIKSALIDPTRFDFEYTPSEGDRFSVHIDVGHSVNEDSGTTLDFGFEFRNGKWVSKKYNVFDWSNEYITSKEGAVKFE